MTNESTMQIDSYGNKVWQNKEAQLHRTDGPAIEYADGTKVWYVNGQYHRTDGPAFEYAHGTKEWWVNGQCHRTDGPAVEYADGTKEWWVNGCWARAIIWTVESHSKVPKARAVKTHEEAQRMMFDLLKEHKCSWVEKLGYGFPLKVG